MTTRALTETTETPEERRARLKEFGQKVLASGNFPLEFERVPGIPSLKDVHYQALAQPRQVRLDLIAACSAACRWCQGYSYTDDRHRDGTVMPFATMARIVDQIATWPEPLTEIVPVNYGEFFMRKDWNEALLYIADKLPKTRIWIPTNGSVLTPQFVERLAGVRTLGGVNFSVNAVFQETYVETMRLPPWVMKRCEDAADELHKLRPDVRIWASMVYNPVLLSELERDLFEEKWRAKGYVTPQVLRMTSWAGMKLSQPAKPMTLPCRSIYTDMVVMNDGEITSCCFDAMGEIKLGNVEGALLLDLWKGQKFSNFRKVHDDGRRAQIPLCLGCSFA